MPKVNIIRSQTWMVDNLQMIEAILQETISEFVEPGDRIINIEVKERSGLSRFWIYVEEQ